MDRHLAQKVDRHPDGAESEAGRRLPRRLKNEPGHHHRTAGRRKRRPDQPFPEGRS